MRADIDGTVRIARIARGFGWTWTEQDVTRFCRAARWSILHEDRDYGPILRTNLEIHLPQCHVTFDREFMGRHDGGNEVMLEMSVYVAVSERSNTDRAQLVAAHRQLRDRLIEALGPTSPYITGEDFDTDYWRRPDVVVSVASHDDSIHMTFVNPRYQRWMDEDRAYEEMYGHNEDTGFGLLRRLLTQISRTFRRNG
ncbi:DUF6301 family protein [Nocardia sp. NPDC003979]